MATQSFPGLVRREPHAARHRLGGARRGRRGSSSRRPRRGAGPSLELTQYAAPCATQAHWFVEGRIARISHEGPARGCALVRTRRRARARSRPGWTCGWSRSADRRGAPRAARAHALRLPTHARRIHGREPRGPPRRARARPRHPRGQLLEQHAAARRRRNAAELGGHEWEQASAEVGRIEVEIARIERAMDPPRSEGRRASTFAATPFASPGPPNLTPRAVLLSFGR